jgi:hypothetical protein
VNDSKAEVDVCEEVEAYEEVEFSLLLETPFPFVTSRSWCDADPVCGGSWIRGEDPPVVAAGEGEDKDGNVRWAVRTLVLLLLLLLMPRSIEGDRGGFEGAAARGGVVALLLVVVVVVGVGRLGASKTAGRPGFEDALFWGAEDRPLVP